MTRLLCGLVVVWLGLGGTKAEDIVIEALDADGNLTFNTISNA